VRSARACPRHTTAPPRYPRAYRRNSHTIHTHRTAPETPEHRGHPPENQTSPATGTSRTVPEQNPPHRPPPDPPLPNRADVQARTPEPEYPANSDSSRPSPCGEKSSPSHPSVAS